MVLPDLKFCSCVKHVGSARAQKGEGPSSKKIIFMHLLCWCLYWNRTEAKKAVSKFTQENAVQSLYFLFSISCKCSSERCFSFKTDSFKLSVKADSFKLPPNFHLNLFKLRADSCEVPLNQKQTKKNQLRFATEGVRELSQIQLPSSADELSISRWGK